MLISVEATICYLVHVYITLTKQQFVNIGRGNNLLPRIEVACPLVGIIIAYGYYYCCKILLLMMILLMEMLLMMTCTLLLNDDLHQH